MTFSEAFRSARGEHSQRYFAAFLDMEVEDVEAIERGRVLDRDTLLDLCKRLDIDCSECAELDDDPEEW